MGWCSRSRLELSPARAPLPLSCLQFVASLLPIAHGALRLRPCLSVCVVWWLVFGAGWGQASNRAHSAVSSRLCATVACHPLRYLAGNDRVSGNRCYYFAAPVCESECERVSTCAAH
jgi:hypothetical protein